MVATQVASTDDADRLASPLTRKHWTRNTRQSRARGSSSVYGQITLFDGDLEIYQCNMCLFKPKCVRINSSWNGAGSAWWFRLGAIREYARNRSDSQIIHYVSDSTGHTAARPVLADGGRETNWYPVGYTPMTEFAWSQYSLASHLSQRPLFVFATRCTLNNEAP